MKNRLNTILLFLMLFSVGVKAQNYSPIINDNTSLFNLYGSMLALHVDSIKTENNGLAHYFLKTFELNEAVEQCDTSYSSTWIGPKMLSSGSSYTFYNNSGDPMLLLPRSEINIPWTFYTYDNGDYLEATITLKEQVTFLGLTDSVKTISLQRKSATHNNMTDAANSTQLKISKNYGFIQAINFLDFPSSANVLLLLVGLSNPQVGMQPLSSRRIYNFDMGDEFHYQDVVINVPYNGDDTKIIRKVIGKYISANTDTIIYTFQESKVNIHYTYQSGTTIVGPPIYEVSTVDQKYIVNDIITYPGTYLIRENTYIWPISYRLEQSTQGNKLIFTENIMAPIAYVEPNSCWTLIADIPTKYISYLEGCGISYRNDDIFPSSNNSRLVYYKKGSDTYGEPLVLSTYSKLTTQALTVYPNPLQQGEKLNISTSHFNAVKLVVYTSSGTNVLESPVLQEDLQTIDLSKLEQGLYLVQLVNAQNEYITTKLIIK